MPHGFVWRKGTSPVFKNVCIIKKWDCFFNMFNLSFIQNIFFFSADEVFRGHEPGQVTNRSVSAADVVLYGVNLVLPLMSQDLLKVSIFFIWNYKNMKAL